MTTEAPKTIPYGVSDFANLRNGNGYYVDRTSLIPNLEELHYQLFLRPRRFGKSLLLSMLGYYYDINAQDRFDTLFAGTWIHDHPTDRRGQYLVLHLDFSKIEGEDVPQIQQSFNRICKTALNAFVLYYKAFIPPDFIQELPKIATFSEAFDILTTPGNGLEHKI
ncbi:MAG: AAA family ATPase, partial [Victivallales bacterium]|nr:AAA family ATPase [Victivallales bacterium]